MRMKYKGSWRVNLAPERWLRDRKHRKVPLMVALIENKSDRNRSEVWFEKTKHSLQRQLALTLTREEREKVKIHIELLNSTRRVLCGPTEEEIIEQLNNKGGNEL